MTTSQAKNVDGTATKITTLPAISVDIKKDEVVLRLDANGHLISNKKANFMVAVLCLVNLLNYVDRFTIAGKVYIP